jgi:hypothetical protein
MQNYFHIDISFYLVLQVVDKYSCTLGKLELDIIREYTAFLSTILCLLLVLFICLSDTYVSVFSILHGPLPHPHTS